ncbi:hypothetical protein [Saccharothrix coeruleofusca]|uniref:Uncharacterized protein n=1 Tax=Saccharothrix coeruleofusca TaxID=33919 RepID=A0A918AH50_9PSEU|nr:hypothetical protein [Saccharothrix coeruleofusca]GGP35970.1 hypothetical protein GCM10010185_03710 [Saccharothrix coeruleofusca]
MSRATSSHNAPSGASVVEPAARAEFERTHPGRSWADAPAWQRDHFRLTARQRAGVSDDQ